jgi:anion-transporting  ArsA/GET3 family ATPase
MDVVGFCSRTRVLIVAGKGGVGKTTVSAALARMAARSGLATLIVEVEGKGGLPAAFGVPTPLGYGEVVLAPGDRAGTAEVRARTLTPDDALLEYLEDHGLRRISRRLAHSGALDVVSTAVPGIKDILVLGKVKQLERRVAGGGTGQEAHNGAGDRPADLIVLDAPAAGHAVTFLMSARGLLDAVSVGPIRNQAADVMELLSDPARCQVMLVTLAEETPVNEVVETAYQLEDRVGIGLAPVVVNGLYPVVEGVDADVDAVVAAAGIELAAEERLALRQAAEFRRHRQDLQASQVERLAEALPLPQLHLPFLFTTDVGRPEIDVLASAMAASVEQLAEPEPAPAAAGASPEGFPVEGRPPGGRSPRATAPWSPSAPPP